MPEHTDGTWLIEEGIGEQRAIRLNGAEIVQACTWWPGQLAAGLVEDAALISRTAGTPRGTARFASGETALVDRLPRDARQGAPIRLEVTRAALSEARRDKLAQARPTDAPIRPAPSLAERLPGAKLVHRFPDCDWDDLVGDALAGETAFTGGSLHFAPTPAMLLIDVDGAGTSSGSPKDLALAAVPTLAASLRRFDCGGSIGIDFPTLQTKSDRRAVDEALAAALDDWPHERTAINGFGFVQIVARMQRPSMLHLAAHHRAGMAARLLLRRAEHLDGGGQIELIAHPAVLSHISADWIAQLSRRSGRQVTARPDPALALEAPHAQILAL